MRNLICYKVTSQLYERQAGGSETFERAGARRTELVLRGLHGDSFGIATDDAAAYDQLQRANAL